MPVVRLPHLMMPLVLGRMVVMLILGILHLVMPIVVVILVVVHPLMPVVLGAEGVLRERLATRGEQVNGPDRPYLKWAW
jgi:hypothetical protein